MDAVCVCADGGTREGSAASCTQAEGLQSSRGVLQTLLTGALAWLS